MVKSSAELYLSKDFYVSTCTYMSFGSGESDLVRLANMCLAFAGFTRGIITLRFQLQMFIFYINQTVITKTRESRERITNCDD